MIDLSDVDPDILYWYGRIRAANPFPGSTISLSPFVGSLLKGHPLMQGFNVVTSPDQVEDFIVLPPDGYQVDEGMPVVESCGHPTAPEVPLECCYDTELGHEPPKLCRCCPECRAECYMDT